MTAIRVLAVVLVLAGIGAGTLIDRIPARQVPRHDGYFVLAGDFHVHSYIGDGGVAPWELAREARRRALDVIVVTNHNMMTAARFAASIAGKAGGPIVIAGQEVTAPRFHMIAAGISQEIDWRLSAAGAIRAIHQQGGIAIAAHPVRNSWLEKDDEALRLLDGAEVAHPLALSSPIQNEQLLDFYRSASERNPSLAAIGSSDFHFAGTLGLCRTFLFARDVTQEGVLEAIRAGRTVAWHSDGRLIGEESLVQLVRRVRADAQPSSAPDWRVMGTAWLTLAGLAVLILFR